MLEDMLEYMLEFFMVTMFFYIFINTNSNM